MPFFFHYAYCCTYCDILLRYHLVRLFSFFFINHVSHWPSGPDATILELADSIHAAQMANEYDGRGCRILGYSGDKVKNFLMIYCSCTSLVNTAVNYLLLTFTNLCADLFSR